jgi:hypothetical protein
MPKPPARGPEGVDRRTWCPAGREGEIVRELEQTTDPLVMRALLSEKMMLDRGRR